MFDFHTHLQDERLDNCRDALLRAAVAAGVTGVGCCATAPGDWSAVAALARDHSELGLQIIPAFGVHPWYGGDLAADWAEQLTALLAAHPRAAVGECGLCGVRREVPPEKQLDVLRRQLELAVSHARPVILHGARAWGALLEAVRPFAKRLPVMVAHSFGGSAEVLHEWLRRGGFVSFSGTVCNRAARHVRAAAALAPDARLLVETDSPDLFPAGGLPCPGGLTVTANSQRPLNHPANLTAVIATMAALRGVPESHIAAITTANARRTLNF